MEKTNDYLPFGFKKSICKNCIECKPYFVGNCPVLQNAFNFVKDFGISIVITECRNFKDKNE